MSDESSFDEYARAYDATVQGAINISGETVQFFADLKAQLMARSLGRERPTAILDFGCGIGNTTRALAATFPSATVTGADPSEKSLAIARGMNAQGESRVRYRWSGDQVLPFDDGTFQAVFTSCVFHHIEPRDRVRWARELKRVIAPGGSFFLFEHNPFNPLTRRVVANVPFDAGVSLLRPRESINILKKAGFEASAPRFYFFFPALLRKLRPLEALMRRIPIGAQYFVVGRCPQARPETPGITGRIDP